MLNPTEQITLAGLLMAAIMLFLWLYQLRSQDAGIVDLGWSVGLGILGLLYAFTGSGDVTRRLLLGLMSSFWSARLAFYLYLRNRNRPEDGRYKIIRQTWGSRVQPFFFIFFQAQALLDVLLSLPFLVVSHYSQPPLGWGSGVALLIWLVAIAGESVADRQLDRFRSIPSNQGKTCRRGLWRYSRHPNYFFEWLHWWSYVFLAWGAPYGWVALTGPVLMFFFLIKVTGIPATEEHALRTRGDEYRCYQKTTSAFIPWFPKTEGKDL
ncbi:MAG: DUF1295 domain-containing protein [Acidobacteriota bacterium]|nr:DUF1295 domain-containing protein [Acidobacteriota bacterium]